MNSSGSSGSSLRVLKFLAHGCSILLNNQEQELPVDGDQPGLALEILEKAVHLNPDDGEALFQLGRQLALLGRYDEAEQSLWSAWEKASHRVEPVRLLIGIILRDPERVQDAELLLRESRLLHPDDCSLKVAQADLLVVQGLYSEARSLYGDVLRQCGGDEDAREGMVVALGKEASLLAEKGQVEQAVSLITQALELAPHWASLHAGLGNLRAGLGDCEQAEQAFLCALELDPDNYTASYGLAMVLKQGGRLEEAASVLSRVLPHHPDARPDLAAVLIDLDRFHEAAQLLREELGFDPDCPVCHNNMALAMVGLGEPARAEHHLQKALQADSNYFKACYNLLQVQVDLGRESDAVESARQLMAIDPVKARRWMTDNDELHPTLALVDG